MSGVIGVIQKKAPSFGSSGGARLESAHAVDAPHELRSGNHFQVTGLRQRKNIVRLYKLRRSGNIGFGRIEKLAWGCMLLRDLVQHRRDKPVQVLRLGFPPIVFRPKLFRFLPHVRANFFELGFGRCERLFRRLPVRERVAELLGIEIAPKPPISRMPAEDVFQPGVERFQRGERLPGSRIVCAL